MDDVQIATALRDFLKFGDGNQIIEIVIRNKNKRFKAFQKVMIKDLQESEKKELAEKAIKALNKNNKLNEKNLRMLNHISKVQNFSFVLSGLDLCATCAGFAIMYEKLDSMSKEINQQLSSLHDTMKKEVDVHSEFEFNKVLADYQDMLDCRKKQKPYSEQRMRDLIDREYNMLTLLINILQMDISSNMNSVITAIFSLLSMFTKSLEYFDQQYYFNNYETLKNGKSEDIWHSSHKKWMGIYDTLSSDWFVEMLQDYAMFQTDLSTRCIDQYYVELIDTVLEYREDIQDNQELIKLVQNSADLNTINEKIKESVNEEIEQCLKDSFENTNSQDYKEMRDYIFNQASVV